MNNRNLLIEDTTFSEERIINTRIHTAFRFRFGCYNRQVKPTATLGDIIDLGEYEVKNYIERIIPVYEKFKIDKGEILLFKKDREHKVLANKDSKFMLIKK